MDKQDIDKMLVNEVKLNKLIVIMAAEIQRLRKDVDELKKQKEE